MDIIESNLAQLKIILTNFRKAPNRKYRRSTLLNKLAEVQTLRNNINNELITFENTIAIGTFDQIRKIERSLTGELQLIIDQKLANLGDKPDITLKSLGKLIVISYRLTKSAKMVTLIETVKTVTALLPTYDGTPSKLRNFLDALKVVKQIATKADQLPTVINIVLTKLEGRARHAFPAAPETIDAIITKLKEVSSPIPPETIIAKLSSCNQRNNIAAYTKEVEELTMQLEAAYIAKEIPTAVAQSMATKEGIKYLTAGLKDEKTAIIIKAGQFKSITEAINKTLEESPQSSNVVTVQYARSHPRQYQSRWQASGNQQFNRFHNSNYRGGRYNYRTQNNQRYHDRPQNSENRENRDSRNENFNTHRRYGNNQSRGSRGRGGPPPQRNVYVSENGRGPSENPQAEARQSNGETTFPNRE